MPLPDDHIAALSALALAFATYHATTGGEAVLVGGAATAIYTAGAFLSGDFDIVAGHDEAFDAAMLAHGFLREDRAGHLLVGYYHPDHLAYGFQTVSGALFDGRADRSRLVRMSVRQPGLITLPAIEDMIADRLAQHAVASPGDLSRLLQARMLFRLAEGLDEVYLERRIREECGDPSLLSRSLDPGWLGPC